MTVQATEEWLTPLEALALVEPHHGAAAKVYLADKLKDGFIRCRATQMWESDRSTVNMAWKNRDKDEIEEDVEVEARVWRSSRFWSEDLDLWRWDDNRFLITERKRPPNRIFLAGLSFAAEDVRQLVKGGQAVGARKGRGGRPKQMDAWTAFWHVVVSLARQNRLEPGRFASQSALREEILLELGPRGLKDETIKPEVRRLWDKFMVLPAETD